MGYPLLPGLNRNRLREFGAAVRGSGVGPGEAEKVVVWGSSGGSTWTARDSYAQGRGFDRHSARSDYIAAGESSTGVSRLYASMDALMLSVSSSSSLPSLPLNICIDSTQIMLGVKAPP